ncbi:DNA mismatch repair protein MutS [Candidatus Entotheonella serta]|nr:DNA mismatch repair protein MutS [Candidatus Entotheonella serta]
MARKKRRKSPPSPATPREEPFHAPFKELKSDWKRVVKSKTPEKPPLKPPTLVEQAQRVEQERRRRVEAERQQREAEQDMAAFHHAMNDVEPLAADPRGQVGKSRRTNRVPLPSDHELSWAAFQDFVNGRSTFTIQYTDEYMEGAAPGVDPHLVQRLHHGDFAIQDQLDLHGYTVDEAKVLLDRFLSRAYSGGLRCVRLIHGRGKNSPDNRPILKEHVQMWLSHGRLSRMVLAFVTAPVRDGGAGAAYVLLRRAGKPRSK